MTLSVLQVLAGLDPAEGGPPACGVATALALQQQDVATMLTFPVGRGREDASADFVAVLRAAGVGVRLFPERPLMLGSFTRRWGFSPRLALWLFRSGSRFDVIHAHSGWTFTTVVGLLAAKMHGCIAVLSTHESLTDFDQKKSGTFRRGIKRLLRWFYLRSFDVVVVASVLEQNDMRDRGGLQSVVVPHAVVNGAVEGKRSSGLDFRVGFLGRLDPKKNLELVIDALALLSDGVSLQVAGDGPPAYRESLVFRAQSRGVDTRVRWHGFVKNATKREFLASIDVLVMPSTFECFGVSAAEAIAAGVPVIVSPHVGVADIVVEYRCGHVVSATAPEIARALRELMDDTGALRELSGNARRAASHEFSLLTHGERIKAQYEGALSARDHRVQRHA
jgi:glycosyltransferase involved in cell wall biosynthesis